MKLEGKVVVVTGGGNGIGRALSRRFAAEGAAGVVVADLDAGAAEQTARDIGPSALAVRTDVAVEEDVRALVRAAEERFGPVDLFCANAGVVFPGGIDAPDSEWARSWDVNLMAHVYAARAVLPSMLDRGEGYLLHTASAAGLLTSLGIASYAVTKHAAVALAEWLAITYGDRGIKVSCLCPQGVHTNMLHGSDQATREMLEPQAIEPEELASVVVEGLGDERFLILPHPEVADYLRGKGDDPERWLRGMRRLHARLADTEHR
jgi:NAD(P)-dependent dehydrogenase (short-subunit alcohol dehydrogenase family)